MDKIPLENGNVLKFESQAYRVRGLFRWIQGRTLAALIFAASALVVYEPAHAQVNPEIASCGELKDEGTGFQTDICSAHIGCRFVMSIQKTCTNIKSYLNRLKAAIGDGVGSLSGGNRYEITPDTVFSAAEGESRRSLANSKFNANPEALRKSQEIRERVKIVGQGEILTGSYADGSKYVYYGEVKDGKPEGFGTLINSKGTVSRGQRNANGANGQMEMLISGGSRFVNEYKNGILSGPGFQAFVDGSTIAGNFSGQNENVTITFANGVRFEGTRANGKRIQGREFRPDGTLAEEGSYENGVLSVGTKYDSAGGRTEINLPRERQLAETQRQRDDAVVAEQRRRDEAMRDKALVSSSQASANSTQHGGSRTAMQGRSSKSADVSAEDCPVEYQNFLQLASRVGYKCLTIQQCEAQVLSNVAHVNSFSKIHEQEEGLRFLESRVTVYPRLTGPDKPAIMAEDKLAYCLIKSRLQNLQRGTTNETAGSYARQDVGSNSSKRGISGSTCEAMKQSVIATRLPSNASITASTETVMFMTKTEIDMIDGGCPTVAGVTSTQIAEAREGRLQQYQAAERNCNAVQSGGRRCVAYNHFGPNATPGSGIRSADPSIPVGSVPR